MPKRKAKPDPRYAEQPAVAAILKLVHRPRGATVGETRKRAGCSAHGALDPQQARFEGRVELKRTKVEGRAGTIYRAPTKRTSS
jgi:hypothetical protein